MSAWWTNARAVDLTGEGMICPRCKNRVGSIASFMGRPDSHMCDSCHENARYERLKGESCDE